VSGVAKLFSVNVLNPRREVVPINVVRSGGAYCQLGNKPADFPQVRETSSETLLCSPSQNETIFASSCPVGLRLKTR